MEGRLSAKPNPVAQFLQTAYPLTQSFIDKKEYLDFVLKDMEKIERRQVKDPAKFAAETRLAKTMYLVPR